MVDKEDENSSDPVVSFVEMMKGAIYINWTVKWVCLFIQTLKSFYQDIFALVVVELYQ